jgi:hypothetical protein
LCKHACVLPRGVHETMPRPNEHFDRRFLQSFTDGLSLEPIQARDNHDRINSPPQAGNWPTVCSNHTDWLYHPI